jgi:hypothetical protein
MLATLPTAPDWATIQEDVHCPLCKYNLRGLIEPRCPECGYRFTWPQVLHPHRREHPYLFEHHPERNLWSFIRTVTGGLLPRRFWNELHPAQPSNVFRLAIYFLILVVFAAMPLVVTAMIGVPETGLGIQIVFRSPWGFVPPPPTLQIQSLANSDWRAYIVGCTVLVMSLPLLSTVFLIILFEVSMARRSVSPVHVFRCVVYSYDIVVPLSLLVTAMIGFNRAFSSTTEHTKDVYLTFGLLSVLLWLIFTYRLYIAYRFCLRFQAPLATVLVAQFLSLMTALALVAYLSPIWLGCVTLPADRN